jgi:fructooligosaccharide transport system substrate-binding protein
MRHRRLLNVQAIAAALAVVSVVLVSAAAPAAAASSTVTLNVFQCEQCVPFPWQVTAFEKAYPSIKLNVSSVPFGEFYTKEAVLAASSSPPDVYAVDQPTLANLAAAGVILPLNKYLSPSYISSLNQAAVSEFSYNGKLYSPGPIDTSLGLYYNKNLLAKAGITPPTSLASTWTWAQAEKAMEACQQGPSSNPSVWGLSPVTFGNGTAGFDYISVLFLRSEGSPTAPKSSSLYKTFWALSPNGSTVSGYVNTPEAIAGATFYQDLYQKAKVSPTSGNPNEFIDGKACFDMNTSNYVDALDQAHVSFSWGVTPWPYFKTPIVHTGSVEIAIGTKTKHLTQALDLINFLSSSAEQTEMISQTGYLPVSKPLYSSLSILKTYPWDIFVQELAKWGEPRPVSPHYLQYSDVMTKAMSDIADGASVASRLNEAVSQLDQLLQTPAGSI